MDTDSDEMAGGTVVIPPRPRQSVLKGRATSAQTYTAAQPEGPLTRLPDFAFDSRTKNAAALANMPQFLELGLHSIVAYRVTVPSWSRQMLSALQGSLPAYIKPPRDPASQSKLTLLDLPLDILHSIFAAIDDSQQAVCLCLSDQRLFDVGIRRVIRLRSSSLKPAAAGDRFICLGEHTENGDYPPGIRPIVASLLVSACSKFPLGTRFFEVALNHYPDGEEAEHTTPAVDEQPGCTLHERILATTSPYAYGYMRLMNPKYDPAQSWVLCNVSKGVYVRADVLRVLSGLESKPPMFHGHGGLAEVLLFRITWSSDPSTGMAYGGGGEKELHRGAWAGDRVVITTMDGLREGVEWEDESEEALSDMVQIWRWEMGDAWVRERIARNALQLGLDVNRW
ncbi:hypothetical protein BC835DRAFT_1422676 [Cytidiella melzeri]|nr:hypothetical protein BC835DRAFT_1422676 [Cytidiella melzeri]